jgi:glycosyltransferase involved in cell wall biosynthesis
MHHFSGFVCWLGQQDGIPMRIAHSHNDTKPKEAGAGLRRKTYLRAMELLIRRCATHGLACSELAAEDLFGEKWADVERWQLLYYGIDLIPFEERISKADVRQEFGFPHSAIILGHVGRFAEQKNHAFLIDIIAAAVNNEPRCRALLVGDGPLRPAIQDKVHKLGLEKHIVFAGVRPDIPRLMKGAMDVFVFPSLHEGLPVTLIEAQAAGLPCITSTQVTRQAAIVEGSVQYTSLAKSPDFWARAAVMMDKSQPSSSPEDALTNIAKTPFTIDYSVQCLCKCYDISKFKRPSAS